MGASVEKLAGPVAQPSTFLPAPFFVFLVTQYLVLRIEIMRITEAGLRKIVREMLKEEISYYDPTAGLESDPSESPKQYVPSPQLVANAGSAYIDTNKVKPIPAAPAPTPPAAPAPVAAPPAKQPRGNPTVMQVQKLIGAPQDGFWGQQTQAKFIEFVTSKINGGVKVTGINDVNALSNWKNAAGQIRLVGLTPTPKGFAPNIDGLISFISMLNSNESASQAVESLTQPEEEKPWDEVKDMTADYFAWNQPGNPKNAYFTQRGVNNMSNTATNLVQPVSNPAPAGRGVFKRQPRKK